MNKEDDKIRAIINELVAYSLQNGATAIDIRLKTQNENKVIEITFNAESFSSEKINDLKKALNMTKSTELEEYYWRILGDSVDESSLYVVGIMVDTFKLDYTEALGVKVTLYRKNK